DVVERFHLAASEPAGANEPLSCRRLAPIRFAVDPRKRGASCAVGVAEPPEQRRLAPFDLRSIPTAWGPSPGSLMSPLSAGKLTSPPPDSPGRTGASAAGLAARPGCSRH